MLLPEWRKGIKVIEQEIKKVEKGRVLTSAIKAFVFLYAATTVCFFGTYFWGWWFWIGLFGTVWVSGLAMIYASCFIGAGSEVFVPFLMVVDIMLTPFEVLVRIVDLFKSCFVPQNGGKNVPFHG